MNLERRTVGGVEILGLVGQIETEGLPALSAEVERVIAAGGTRLCLNCRGVTLMNSTAIGYLVETAKRLKAVDGELVLSELSRFMSSAARTLQLDLILEILPTDEAAVAHLAGETS